MKRTIAVLLTLVMVLSLAACGGDDQGNGGDASEIAKIGLGVAVDLSSSSADEDGALAQSDSTIAGVAFDADGKIVKVILDVAQDKVNVNDGVVEEPAEFKSKKELGPDYGMLPVSEEVGIGKEWDEQAVFLEDYFVGMTADEVVGIPVDEATTPTEEDVLAGATIHIGAFQEAVKKAWDNAVDVEGVANIGLGIVTNLGGSTKDADDQGGAVVQFEDNISLLGLDADGKIVASQTDVAQNSVAFTAEDQLDGEHGVGTTKKELGPEYGMLPVSEEVGIGKEWDEQAQAYDEHLVGLDADGVSAIGLDDDGYPTDEDLLAGATITVDAFVAATQEAFDITK